MTFNEFQRELQKRNISPENAYMFTLIYERLGHIMKEHEAMAKAIVQLVQNTQDFVTMREDDRKAINNLMKSMRESGVEVKSVGYTPEEIEAGRKKKN